MSETTTPETNYCPGCGHPVLLRAPGGTCGDEACRAAVARRDRGEPPVCPTCGEAATHIEPLVLRGRQQAWCPSAHRFAVPAYAGSEAPRA